MAWGVFNKIKKGFKKAFKFIKDKIVSPLLKHAPDIMSKYGPMLASMPGKAGVIGQAITTAAPFVETLTDKFIRK